MIGPLLIKCGNEDNPFYWVENGGKITITEVKVNATQFAIDIEKDEDPTMLAIQKYVKGGPMRRLTYEVSVNGRNPSDRPPALRENPDRFQQMFSLKDPRKRMGNKTNPHDWISNEDLWLYIRCSIRFQMKQSRLCMKKPSPNEDYELTIVPSTREHNPPKGYMLFCIERVFVDQETDAEN